MEKSTINMPGGVCLPHEPMLINANSMNYTDSYITETHVIEEALKERYLTGQSVRAVTMMMFL